MCSIQIESKQIVVKTGIFPICWSMANCAIGTIIAIVFIILFVAGVAVGWGASKLMRDGMAIFASNMDVLPLKFIFSQVMIEFRIDLPAFGIMAICAGAAKTIGMRVILCMTGLANYWRGL